MGKETYDVFLSYNFRDQAVVASVAQALAHYNVRVWFDEDIIVAGDSIPQKLNEGLSESRVLAVCFGPAGFGNWHMQEVGAAIMRRVEKGARLIPVLLPGVNKYDNADLPPLLSVLKPFAVEPRPAFESSVERLAAIILNGVPRPHADRKRPTSEYLAKLGENGDNPTGEAIDDLYQSVQGTGALTFFLGAGSSEPGPDGPPPPYEIAQELLAELEFIGPKYSELIPPLDAASSYYAVKKTESALESKVTELVLARSHCAPALHENLAAVVSKLGRLRAEVYRRRPSRRPQLIVSTSIDVMCERALLRAGLSFTRVVQHRSGTQVTINEYRDVALAGRSIRINDREGKKFTIAADHTDGLDEAIAACGFRNIHSVEGDVQPIPGLKLSDASDLVLYKYHGSYDVEDSCALSTEDYLNLAVTPFVPEAITEIIGNSPTLFLLCGILDADVRHVYHTLLRRAYTEGGKRLVRVAVVRPPTDPEVDSYRRMEIRMWARAKNAVRDQMGIKVVEGDTAKFLNRFLRRFPEIAS